jgi:hypothetical protein
MKWQKTRIAPAAVFAFEPLLGSVARCLLVRSRAAQHLCGDPTSRRDALTMNVYELLDLEQRGLVWFRWPPPRAAPFATIAVRLE